jgi:hypothetical protein
MWLKKSGIAAHTACADHAVLGNHAAVLEAAHLSEAEMSEYCRRKGVEPQQLSQWLLACEQANRAVSVKPSASGGDAAAKDRIRQLERELRRKEAALAETAALLVLRKKATAIRGKEEEE